MRKRFTVEEGQTYIVAQGNNVTHRKVTRIYDGSRRVSGPARLVEWELVKGFVLTPYRVMNLSSFVQWAVGPVA